MKYAMSNTFKRIQEPVNVRDIRISEHGYDELSQDGIYLKDILDSFNEAVLVEDYPDYPKGPCVLVLQKDHRGDPIHVIWGIPKGTDSPSVLVTAYRPNQGKWSEDFLRRRE